jgi:hypothetical protein
MRSPWRIGPLVVAASLLLAATASAQTAGQKAKEKTLPPPADAKHQLTTGVIVKAEPVTRAGAAEGTGRSVRLTINTAVLWRDWSRDQATTTPKPPKPAAALGNRSVATDGEPIAPDNTVVVVVDPDTKIETRYRSPTDEISDGAKDPANAARVEARTDPKDSSNPRSENSVAKPPKFTADDLKPGLFVEIHYKETRSREKATLLRVLRPVGGPQTSARDDSRASSPK